MFDENKYMESDDLMRSILSQGQEDVPARVWEGISSELDRIEAARTRKTVMLWFRRAGVAVAAAAAAVIGIFTDWNGNGDIIPATTDRSLIAVADAPQVNDDTILSKPISIAERNITYLADASEEVAEAMTKADEILNTGTVPEEKETISREVTEPFEERWPDVWEDEVSVKERKRRGISIVLSGVAGTNEAKSSGMGLLRRPSMSTSRPKTGVEQKSSESTYGLPVSLGAGVRIDLGGRWSLGVGANYTILTRKFFGTYTLVDSDGSIVESVSSDIRNAQQYVGIPVNAYYNIIDKDFLNFYAYAGGTVERCVSDKYDILNTSYIYKGSVKGVQASANVGLGVEFILGRYLGMYLDPSVRYYFDCGQPKSIRTAQPLMLGFEAGLRIRL